jgi:hypothetical protein
MRRLVAIAMLSALFVTTAAAAPAFACGCGSVVGTDENPATASHERAIIHWDGDRETIELSLDIDSDGTAVGMIIPTPLPALVSAGDARLFTLLEETIAPQRRVETDWWGLGYLLPDPPVEEVTILDRVQVGPYETLTLAASDSSGLTTWLAVNGFTISPAMERSLTTYVELGWTFTAVRMTSEQAIDGHVDPIRLTFDTPRLVYPMRLARAETTPQSLRIFVLDKQRVNVSKATAPTVEIDGSATVVWAGAMTDSRLATLGKYLTVFDIRYDEPSKQVTSDLGFVYSTNDQDVRPETVHYKMITLLGIPVGTLLVGWTLLGMALVAGHIVGRRRAR